MNKKTLQHALHILIPLISVLFLFFGIHLYLQRDTAAFRKFTGELFVAELSQDTLSMHYSCLHPENYGIDAYQVGLPDFNEESYQGGHMSIENKLSSLNSIDSSHLSENDALTYDILNEYLQVSLETAAFSYYEEPLSPGSGIQSQLPILLAEYSFNCKKDIDDYLGLLDSCKSYFDSIGVYEANKSELGLFMPDYSADKVIKQCSVIMNADLLKEKKHFLITTFDERLETAQQEGLITQKEGDGYRMENERLLTTVVQPAYASLGDTLLLLKGTSRNEQGLCYLENGKDYYTLSLGQNTGSGKTAAELKALLYKRLQEDVVQMQAKAESIDSLGLNDTVYTFPLESPEIMLLDLQEKIREDYPAFPNPNPSPEEIAYTVKKVSPSLRDFVSPAFYLTPQIDNITDNVIYVNEKLIPDDLEMYTTLAHEGYPGHLYQSVYNQLHQDMIQGNPARSLLNFGGYTEGWALYVENLSYEYAKEVIAETVEDPGQKELLMLYSDLYRLDRDMRLCLYSILDIAIHYDGISVEDTYRILSQFGMRDDETVRIIYEYIVEEAAVT